MKKLVIAGNTNEAKYWIIQDLGKKYPFNLSLSMSDYVIIDSPTKLRGMIDPHGVFVGTWKSRADLNDIIDVLHNNSRGNNTALYKIRSDIQIKVQYRGISPDDLRNEYYRELML